MVPALPMEWVERVTPAPDPRRSLSFMSRTRLAATALAAMVTVELIAELLSMRASEEASGTPADQLAEFHRPAPPFQVVAAQAGDVATAAKMNARHARESGM